MDPEGRALRELGGLETVVRVLDAIEAASFRLFRSVSNTLSKGRLTLPSGANFSDCYELSFVRVARPAWVALNASQPRIPLRLFQTDKAFDAAHERT